MTKTITHAYLCDASGRPLELTELEAAPVCPLCGRGPQPARLMVHWVSQTTNTVQLQCPRCDHAERRPLH